MSERGVNTARKYGDHLVIQEGLDMERGVVWENQWSSVCVCVRVN